MHGRPRMAIVDSNVLAAIGLKHVLEEVMPVMQVEIFNSFTEFEASGGAAHFFHYFVHMSIVLSHREYFQQNSQKTIVLTNSLDAHAHLSSFHCLCTHVSEHEFVKSLLVLEQGAHAHGRKLPPLPKEHAHGVLSEREIEVLALIVKGYINKEIADRLNIGMTTVITHRKNIMDKLNMRSISALTIYAVMNGYVDINKI